MGVVVEAVVVDPRDKHGLVDAGKPGVGAQDGVHGEQVGSGSPAAIDVESLERVGATVYLHDPDALPQTEPTLVGAINSQLSFIKIPWTTQLEMCRKS